MKIAIIGAAYPFRGGNAHYTSVLYLNLKKRHDVKLYTYKRQYPQFLYPGKTDRDKSKKVLKIDEAIRILDYANPITWYATYEKIKKDAPNLLIFNWFTIFAAFQFFVIATLIKRHTKTKILFIGHNVIPHEPSFFDKVLTIPALRTGDFFIVHSKDDFLNLKKFIPEANVEQAHLPIFDIFSFNKVDKKTAKDKLGLKGKVLLFFGFVRKYKGLEYLIRALPLILEQLDVKLLVVGEFWEGKKMCENLISELNLNNNVKVIAEYVPNEDVGIYFSACDIVVLPYTSATGSGIVQIANSFSKPSVVTKVGCFPDVVENGKTGYLVEPKDPSAIAKAVLEYFSDPKNEKVFNDNIDSKKNEFSWDIMVEIIEGLYASKDHR